MKKILTYIFLTFFISASASAQTTYYVSASGNDANAGTSQGSPWKTTFAIPNHTFIPGDSILFKRGEEWEGEIIDTLSGTQANPIVIGAYGSGAVPLICSDLRGRSWSATPGQTGIYQIPLGGQSSYSWLVFQKVGTTVDSLYAAASPRVRSQFPAEYYLFYSTLTQGTYGLSYQQDTLFVHTYNNVALPVARDSLRVYRSGTHIYGHDVIVQDLECRYCYFGFQGTARRLKFQRLRTRLSNASGIQLFQSQQSKVFYCSVDSAGDEGYYSVANDTCEYAFDTVRTVVGTRGLVDGNRTTGVDAGGIGILDAYSIGDFPHYRGNSFHDNWMSDAQAGTFDFFYAYQDTFYNNYAEKQTNGAYPTGASIEFHDNTVRGTTPFAGMNMGCIAGYNPLNVNGNILDSVSSYGFGIDIGGGTEIGNIYITRNAVRCKSNGEFVEFWHTATLCDSNAYVGAGKWVIGPFGSQTVYSSLATYQAGTGYDMHSTVGDYFIMPRIVGNGTITPYMPEAFNSGAGTVRYLVTSGTLLKIQVDSVNVDSTVGYTFTNITRDHTVQFNFTFTIAPDVPVLSSPLDGATGQASNVILSWNASSGATSYRLQVSTSAGFGTTVYDQSGLTGLSQAMSGLAAGTYYWRVNATNTYGTSAYSSAWSFAVSSISSPLYYMIRHK